MKPQLIVIVAAVLLLGCGNPDGAMVQAAKDGNIVAAKQAVDDDDADVNAETGNLLKTPPDQPGNDETADLLCKHGGKTGEELKTEGKE